jgi:glycosyltransferase involved in cell wall biosynthesis
MRVGIEFPFLDDSWLGGVTAIANLLHALWMLDDRRIEPVLIAALGTPDSLLEGMPPIQVLRTRLLDKASSLNRIGRLSRRVIGRNLPFELWLKKNRIDVFSHCSPLGRRASVPTVGHIADFGYKYFRDLYPSNVFANKDNGMSRVCNEYDMLLLSSQAAEADYRRFFPAATARSAVLNIVPSSVPATQSSVEDLLGRYAIPPRYFYSPNQFWVHKNHLAVVEALAITKAAGHDIHMVCTGNLRDSRKLDHFEAVMQRAKNRGVLDQFHVLGIVPYADVIDLMRHSIAVVSASLFEGWGISVTEAKILGKAVVLSDIPVFREQNPEHAAFFNPAVPDELAQRLIAAADDYREDQDRENQAVASARHPRWVRDYAGGFEDIVLAAAALRTGATRSAS